MEGLIYFLFFWPIIVFVVGYLIVRSRIVRMIDKKAERTYKLATDYVAAFLHGYLPPKRPHTGYVRYSRGRSIPVTRVEIDIPAQSEGRMRYYRSDPDGNPIRDTYNPDGRQYL